MPPIRFLTVAVSVAVVGCSPGEPPLHHTETTGPSRIVADLPAHFAVSKKTPDAIIAQDMKVALLIARCPGSRFRGLRSSLSQIGTSGSQSGKFAVPEEQFHTGEITGYKYLFRDKKTGATLEAKYLLQMPGGYVYVALSGQVGDEGEMGFNESDYEAAISTARIVGSDSPEEELRILTSTLPE